MMNNYIILKGGLIKAYDFDDEFYKKHTDLVDKFSNLFYEIYSGVCSVYGATEKNKENIDIKQRLVDILEEFYNLDIEISNGFDNTIYSNFDDIREYVLEYGKGVE